VEEGLYSCIAANGREWHSSQQVLENRSLLLSPSLMRLGATMLKLLPHLLMKRSSQRRVVRASPPERDSKGVGAFLRQVARADISA
jgi:hypothetical protein